MQWHTVLIAAFIVSITIVVLSNYSNSAGWVYVFILLLAAMLVWPGFTEQLQTLNGNTAAPQQKRPGQPF